MTLEGFLNAAKEFFFDLLGYLIPGFLMLVLFVFSFTYDNSIHIWEKFGKLFDSSILGLVIAYVLGYMIYGLAIMRDRFFDEIKKWKLLSWFPYKTEKDVLLDISKRSGVQKAIEILNKQLTIIDPANNLKLNEYRSIAMSQFEDNQMIYLFRMRSDLAKHSAVVFWIYSLIGFINLIYTYEPLGINKHPWYIYLTLLFAAFFLDKTRIAFMGYSFSIPFSKVLGKAEKNKAGKETKNDPIEIHVIQEKIRD